MCLSNLFQGRETDFISEFRSAVIGDRKKYKEYETAAAFRRNLLQGVTRRKKLKVNTHGATEKAVAFKKLSYIIKKSAVTERQGRLLFRITRHYRPSHILELGTSAGISTVYLSLGNPDAELVTVEGNSDIARTAQENFASEGYSKIRLLNCTFKEALDKLKNTPWLFAESFKTVFIDGDHSYEATMQYIDFIKRNIARPYIIIIHDINWSGGMKRAWKEIASLYGNCDFIGLGAMGMVFSL
jgi:predicted O-methyltransferase YrrM